MIDCKSTELNTDKAKKFIEELDKLCLKYKVNIWVDDSIHIHDIEEDDLTINCYQIMDRTTDNKNKSCTHYGEKILYYDYVQCKKCFMIHTDSQPEWGIAKDKWFKHYGEAVYYRDHGKLPE